ncbi:hypothetical protein ES332_A08G232900v1 [Gossypium tomentosum]|uniref:MADS-box domain-containing protein n=1 Tax=Gossypium tomentosum TaxID=34277 RepID=A0A5D2PJC0_GOSTO|nr:hypothetical protein ES332_A08G232900v1 [Gossypium tomentosum]
MTRKNVKLAYITNDSARKATYKKRKKGLMKKVSELSTLCGINVCAIMYNPYESQPKVWPSPMGVQRMEQSKKMVNQESFLSQRISKATEQLKKHCKDNWEKEMTQVMFNNISGERLLDENMREIDKRIAALANTPLNLKGALPSLSSSVAALPPMTMVTLEVISRVIIKDMLQTKVNNMDQIQRQQWIIEMMNNNNKNPQTHMAFGGNEMMFQFGDNINLNNGLWSNTFFP